MLVDWQVARLEADSDAIQSPDKQVINRPYWFFKHWPDPRIELDIIDFCKMPLIHVFENRVLHFYVLQSLIAFLKRKKYDLIISHSARSALVFAFLRSVIPATRHEFFRWFLYRPRRAINPGRENNGSR